MLFTKALLALAAAAPTCFALRPSPSHEALHQERGSKRLSLTRDLIALHKKLTEIPSVTDDEHDVGQWLASSLVAQGYSIEKQYVTKEPSRFNILAWPGASRDAPVLLSSHIDTVPPFYPYKHHHQTISGRGSVDDKASVAAQIVAVNNLLSHNKISPDDVNLLFVVGEETGGDGMRKANELHLKPKTILFGEPTEGKLAAGHKGNLAFSLKAKGKAAHSGYPWLGRSANEVLVRALAALMELAPDLPRSEKYGVTTINLGRIEGGVAANVVAEFATAGVAVRLAAGTPEEVKKEIVNAVYTATASFQEGDEEPTDVIEVNFGSAGYGPINIDHDVSGFGNITVNYGTDIPNLKQTVEGQKRYLYGPGSILVAHSDHEAVTEGELWDAVHGYERLILHALGKSTSTGLEIPKEGL